MANAPLTLRFGSDVEGAKKGIASLATSIASNMATVAGSALSAGKTVAAAGQGIVSTFQAIQRAQALMAPAIFAVVTAFLSLKLAESAISGVKERLGEMLDVADKAKSRGLSAEFLQAFTSSAKGAEDRIKSLEEALDHAFQATKGVVSADWQGFFDGADKSVAKVSAIEQALRGARELFDSSRQTFTGLDLFRNAQSQDQKVQAVLTAMKELKLIGQDVAAFDLGEKMFGSKFADDVRRGTVSVDGILKSLDTASTKNFISNEAAKNAKDLDDRLNDAWHTISERLKPDWDDLASVALRIKGLWTDIIEAVSKYKVAENKARGLEGSGTSSDDNARNNPDPERAAFANPVILNQGRRRRGQAPDISPAAPKAPSEADALDAYSRFNDLSGEQPKPEAIPFPRSRPHDAPKPPAETKEHLDQIETLINLMTKANDTLQVELDTEGKSNVEREKGIALAKAEAAARAAQRDLTDAEKSKVLQLAEAHATLANKLKDVQQQLAANAENARFFGNEASTALGNLFIDGQKFNDVLANVEKQWAKLLLQATFTGQGPFANLLGFAPLASSGPNAVGGLAGLISGLTNGTRSTAAASATSGFTSNDFSIFRAGGGDVKAGRAYTVGETGMEKFVPGTDGKIYPIGKGGIGGGNVTNHILVDVTGATGNSEIARMVNVGMQAAYARAIADAPGAVINHQRRRA